ncbi:FecR family protein [Chitinophaga arvensicola]|uniref:Ferric-dicitrate binding protein FerR, regulates iron transport through sigma-19 n=1 Tax=Chitinophaga arvensicola TaxID=29529 RepID=A0A1I0QIE6_9BACT|nr:FecR family protein [Chitinophaga arvensicola]SEW26418.1 ferric-dicitrate binding protein FerR, regulates iron transport through sigma-19 [Chitinophaga arvensicola]
MQLSHKHHTLIRSKIKALINKYLDSKATPEEEQLLHNWLDVLAEDARPGAERDAQSREQLRLEILAAIKQRTGQTTKVFPIWKKWSAAAAVLVMLGAGSWWMLNSWSSRKIAWLEMRTAIGEKKMLLLPDSSRIWLGANAVLKYPDHFTSTRQVELVSGEAFFDIAPATNQPFSVSTDSLEVQVLGTSFHIRAYPHQLMEIGVSTGKISVSKNKEVLGLLTANQLLQINRNGYTFSQSTVSFADSNGWKQDKIVFDNMPVADALLLLENYYPVKFHVKKPLYRQITGSLSMHLTITQIINVLDDLTDHQLKIKPAGAGNYTIDQ